MERNRDAIDGQEHCLKPTRHTPRKHGELKFEARGKSQAQKEKAENRIRPDRRRFRIIAQASPRVRTEVFCPSLGPGDSGTGHVSNLSTLEE